MLGLARIIGIKHAWHLGLLRRGHIGCLADGLRPRSKVIVRTALTFALGGWCCISFRPESAGQQIYPSCSFYSSLSSLLAAGMALGLFPWDMTAGLI